jgi:hypothetical protein
MTLLEIIRKNQVTLNRLMLNTNELN